MSWIEEVLKSHEEVETPQSFYFWSGLCAISAVLKDNVFLNRGGAYILYPNIYVILHADSGLKKGPAINLAKDLVKRTNNTKLISGRSSIQGILKKLGTGQSQPGGRVEQKSAGFICSSELSSSLVDDPAALTILTDLYDRNYNAGEWESLLKMEQFNLIDPTVSLLGGINEAHSETFFEKKDIQGGFLARTFIVHEKEEQNINSLSRRITNPPDKDKLVDYLKLLGTLRGPVKEFSDDKNELTATGKIYDDWYNSYKTEIKSLGIKDETGTLNRFGDSVIKVALLLSLSRRPVLEIDPCDMLKAIEVSQKLIGNVRAATLGKNGISNSAKIKKLIINELMTRENNQISRVMLMKKLWLHFSDPTEFDELMLSFDHAGMIKTEVMGNQIIYRMPEEQVQEMQRFLMGKMR